MYRPLLLASALMLGIGLMAPVMAASGGQGAESGGSAGSPVPSTGEASQSATPVQPPTADSSAPSVWCG